MIDNVAMSSMTGRLSKLSFVQRIALLHRR